MLCLVINPKSLSSFVKTGPTQISTVMRRLLTGHAIRYNRRHKRHGHLFQNRYKSILCQEDAYLLELVRYIHLNPLRAKLVTDIHQLEQHPFSGHGGIMGRIEHAWQNRDKTLLYFDKSLQTARDKYRQFMTDGIEQGRRDDLTGGGLIRSAGGCTAVREQREGGVHLKSDERILGDSDFVNDVLAESEERLERYYKLKSKGIDINFVVQRVSTLLDITPEEIFSKGKFKHLVRARSLLCFWAVRELGVSMASMARRLNISTAAVSKSVARGAEIVWKECSNYFKLIS